MQRGLDPFAPAAWVRVLAVILALAVGVLAGCGAEHSPRGGRRAATTGTTPAAPTQTSASTVTAPDPGPPALEGMYQLRRQLGREMKLAGAHSGAYVYDLTTGTPVFSLRASTKRPPASVEKLWTSTAALYEMGSRARLHTTVLGTGSLGPGGVWRGNLYLRGGGDPTFGSAGFDRVWDGGYGATVSSIVAQLVRDGIRRVTGRVIGDASLFDSRLGVPSSRFAPDLSDIGGELGALTYNHGASAGLSPGAFAAHALALTMRSDHIWALAARRTAVTPPGTSRLARVSSPPLSELLRLMNVPSDDFFAELLAKQLGARFGRAGTTAAGARVISTVMASEYDLHPHVVDGSGLSREDRASPLEVVDLLHTLWRTSLGDVLWDSLPTVGVDGTVATIATRTPAQGRCVAKTGTLSDVTNLAGYCHAAGHQVVAFALFIDGPENWQALELEGKMVADIAARDPGLP